MTKKINKIKKEARKNMDWGCNETYYNGRLDGTEFAERNTKQAMFNTLCHLKRENTDKGGNRRDYTYEHNKGKISALEEILGID